VLIGGGDSIEDEVWTGHTDHLGREVVQQICDSVEPFYLVESQNRSLKEQETHDIINGVKDALDFIIPRRSVWTRHL
jgi:hypothetical protein